MRQLILLLLMCSVIHSEPMQSRADSTLTNSSQVLSSTPVPLDTSARTQTTTSCGYFELLGSGGLGSFNYEQAWFKLADVQCRWRVGFSVAPIDPNNGFGLVFPVMIHALIGSSTHACELGLGQGITITTKGSAFFLTTASLGYRYHPEQSRWFYRFTYTPLISYLVDLQYQHWGGMSIGYTF